jgi:hypothetical protein
MKKGPKHFRFDPFLAFDIAPKTNGASAQDMRPASAVAPRLGLLDRLVVVPGAPNSNFAHARRSKVGYGLGILVAASPESRAAPGRELVDLGGPVIQTRIHRILSFVAAPWCARLILDSLSIPDIVPASR